MSTQIRTVMEFLDYYSSASNLIVIIEAEDLLASNDFLPFVSTIGTIGITAAPAATR